MEFKNLSLKSYSKLLKEIEKLKEENKQTRQRIEELETIIKGLSILFDEYYAPK